MRIVVLGAGESGAGAAVLAKVKGFDTFVSDMSAIKDKYKELLDKYGIAWEEGHHTEDISPRTTSRPRHACWFPRLPTSATSW